MSSARPRPDSNPLLVVFIIGGLSIAEMRAVKEMMTLSKPNFEVITYTNEKPVQGYKYASFEEKLRLLSLATCNVRGMR